MGRIVIELTNRCNLHCLHCFEGRHGGRGQLPLAVLDRILNHACTFGFDDLAFTGGEPTVHSRFAEIGKSGLEVDIHLGLRRLNDQCTTELNQQSIDFQGHAWLTANGHVLLERHGPIQTPFRETYRYPN